MLGIKVIINKLKRIKNQAEFNRKIKNSDIRNIVIGASGISDIGWISSESYFLNLLKPLDWQRYFKKNTINAILAEHVWEHLTLEEGLMAAKQCFEYLKPGGYLRIAVPDGCHPDPVYIKHVEVGGIGPGSDDHKVLYTFQSAKKLFEAAGFKVTLLEYFNGVGEFCAIAWDPAMGKIHRSKQYDERNSPANSLKYTSIILDAHKP